MHAQSTCSVRRTAILELIGRKIATIERWKEQRRKISDESEKTLCEGETERESEGGMHLMGSGPEDGRTERPKR